MKARVCGSRSFAHKYALSSTDALIRNAFKRVLTPASRTILGH
jgi:hypothetical protein